MLWENRNVSLEIHLCWSVFAVAVAVAKCLGWEKQRRKLWFGLRVWEVSVQGRAAWSGVDGRWELRSCSAHGNCMKQSHQRIRDEINLLEAHPSDSFSSTRLHSQSLHLLSVMPSTYESAEKSVHWLRDTLWSTHFPKALKADSHTSNTFRG